MRLKVFAFIVLGLLALYFVQYRVWGSTLMKQFEQLEHRSGVTNMERIFSLLKKDIEQLEGTSSDWAEWDDPYQFALGKNPTFVKENINENTTYNRLRINTIIFTDVNGHVIYAQRYDIINRKLIPILPSLLPLVSRGGDLFPGDDLSREIKGVIVVDGIAMEFASRPILTTSGRGPPAGRLLMAREITERVLRRFEETTRLKISLHRWKDSGALRSALLKKPILLKMNGENRLLGYVAVRDYRGRPSLIFSAKLDRELHHQGLKTRRFLFFSMVFIGVLFLAFSLLFMEFSVLKRISRLNKGIQRVAFSRGAAGRVPSLSGGDELANLSRRINSMLESLEEAEKSLQVARDDAMAANNAKSRFLANMSHEIRTPLNGVLGMLQLVSDTPLHSEQQQMVATAHASALSLLAILNDILDFSKIEAGRLHLVSEAFSPAEILEEVASLFSGKADEMGIELVLFVHSSSPPVIIGDSTRFRQILGNLVSNAVKFTDSGDVTMEMEQVGDSGELRVQVSDTGCGISPEQGAGLFESFSQADGSVTRQKGGTGLGLAICKHLVTLMGGEIGFESQEGEGSLFWFTLPSSGVLTGREGLGESLRDFNGKAKYKVILFIGHEKVRASLAHSLHTMGHDVRHVFSMEELEISVPGKSTVLIVDYTVAGSGGLIQWVDGLLSAVSVIGLRPAKDTDPVEGMDYYLQKPVGPRQLEQLFEQIGGESKNYRPAYVPVQYSGNVLLAEDNRVNQVVVLKMLEYFGIAAHVVVTGVDALARRFEQQFDLILMDCQMPQMDGYEATRQIRAREEMEGLDPVPVVALTAHAFPEDREQCFAAGMNGYIAKPLTKEELAAVLAQFTKTTGN
ncbi:response regulator [Myxococcota bacterium]|nr:response regulator [Myxococcota bacterium]MBU1534084.1 response regulator [Myxococcota bacterium]